MPKKHNISIYELQKFYKTVLESRIRMFLGLPDPDKLVRGIDPDPAPDPDPSFSQKDVEWTER
jgi:hypothetical protein